MLSLMARAIAGGHPGIQKQVKPRKRRDRGGAAFDGGESGSWRV